MVAVLDVGVDVGKIAPLAKLPANGFGGTEKNSQFLSTVLHSYRHDNKVLDMWVCVPFNGIAHYSYDGGGWSGVENISTDAADFSIVLSNRTACVLGAPCATLQAFTIAGAPVAAAHSQQNLDLSHLSSGIYIIVATDLSGRSKALKVILR